MVPASDELVRRDGVAGPLKLFQPDECRRLLTSLADEAVKPGVWYKGLAVASRAYYDIATDPGIVSLMTPILGDNVILWGASLLTKSPGAVHLGHTDIESADPRGGFVSLWIGLEGTSRVSGVGFITGSHRLGISVQEAFARRGEPGEPWSDKAMLAAARDIDASAELIAFDCQNGDGVLFDGRIWHGSRNLGEAPRTALLLQYASADRAVRMPATFDWPFVLHEGRPPVLVVAGMAPAAVNRLVFPPPVVGDSIANAAHVIAVPAEPAQPFVSLPHFHGSTPMLDDLECHSSMLQPGAVPHAPHVHPEEEILVIVAGEGELLTVEDGDEIRRTRVSAGDFAFYPAFQRHSLRNRSNTPVLYTMFRWANPVGRWGRDGGAIILKGSKPLSAKASTEGYKATLLLERPSRWLKRVHAHISVIPPGHGYDAHVDGHDVAIVLIAGAVETLGRTVNAPAVLIHPAGELHGLRSVGAGPARYLVVEFEGWPYRLRLIRVVRRAYRAGISFAGRVRRSLRRRLSALTRAASPAAGG